MCAVKCCWCQTILADEAEAAAHLGDGRCDAPMPTWSAEVMERVAHLETAVRTFLS